MDLEEVYHHLREFVRRFQPNLFIDEEFHALEICLQLFKLLFSYHDAQLITYLDSKFVEPAMYAIPWFITFFASRMESPELVLNFWERLNVRESNKQPDVAFIFFFAVALVTHNKALIF